MGKIKRRPGRPKSRSPKWDAMARRAVRQHNNLDWALLCFGRTSVRKKSSRLRTRPCIGPKEEAGIKASESYRALLPVLRPRRLLWKQYRKSTPQLLVWCGPTVQAASRLWKLPIILLTSSINLPADGFAPLHRLRLYSGLLLDVIERVQYIEHPASIKRSNHECKK